MKKTLFIICVLLSGTLTAQQLYFIRAIAEAEYEFYELPPVQIITYTPERDTMLQVYKDYTEELNRKFKRLKSIVYYPKYKTFCFSVGYPRKFFSMEASQYDTLCHIVPKCPAGYDQPLEINIIDNYWAYDCYNHEASQKQDVFMYRGIDFSLRKRFDLKTSNFKDLYLTGIIRQRITLKPNDGRMYLPIVADTAQRPPFSVELPQKYWVDKKVYRTILVNDEQKMILSIESRNPKKDKDYGDFSAALYNKQKDRWSDIKLKGNAPIIMAYEHWLAGVVQDGRDYDANYFHNKLSPGKAARDSVYMECSFDEMAQNYGFYRPGILYLFNTDTEKYIEWNTGQGDSEILLVQDEMVYYRVFDEIYKAAIINGEALDKPELLVKDNQTVPQIHWAFIGQ
jgi:hypothetical protein